MIEKVTLELNRKSELVLADSAKCKDLNPKALLLFAAAKCAGLTALHILEKERIKLRRFEITVSGEMSTDTVKAETVFRSFSVIYNIECGREVEQAKVSHAVSLAHEKYCGLVRMLRSIAPVSHEIAIVSTQPAHV